MAFKSQAKKAFDVDRACPVNIVEFDWFARFIAPISGVLDLAAALKALGVPLAVATNAERSVAALNLSIVGATDLFDVVVSVSDGVPPKPDPALFELATKRLAVRPQTVFVVEASAQGAAAAALAGMRLLHLAVSATRG